MNIFIYSFVYDYMNTNRDTYENIITKYATKFIGIELWFIFMYLKIRIFQT